MAYRISSRTEASTSSSSQPAVPQEDLLKQKPANDVVQCVYQTHIAGFWRNMTINWSRNLMNHTLTMSVDSIKPDHVHTCKIDFKPWHFWAKKGYKTFEIDGGDQLEAYWDLRSAKFSNSPEPCSDYYVALVSEEEVVLLLGDLKKKAYKRTKSRPALVEAVMFYKREHVFAKKSFATRAKFDQRKREHDIIVESSVSGPKEPEMWISIDGIVLVHVSNLQWKFRGNQTVLVDKQQVQVFWDVYAWLFCDPGSSHGLFIFKPGAPDVDSEGEDNSNKCDYESDESAESMYYSTKSYSKASKFLLFMYAWKLE